MSKPFSIQSPENIAKDYGGNKQKIAEAMQMGIVDATAGVLAGMFIDRMRSAQVQEGVPQATVAQQVMGGVQAAPPGVPSPSSGGLGATQQAAPPMTPPQMGAPEEAPMVMADGGLASLPVPDAMFDEPSNGGFDDGYGGGGLVAFGEGGDVPSFAGGSTVRDPLSWLHAPVTSLYGVKRSTGAHQGQDFAISKDTPIGVPAPGKVVTASTDNVNGNFVVVKHPDGTRSSYSHLSAFNVEPGQVVDAGEVIGLSGNTGRVRGKGGGYHLHFGARDAKGNRINPADFLNRIASQTASGMFPERDQATAAGRAGSVMDMLSLVQNINRKSDEELDYENRLRGRLEEQASDEYYEKQRKSDMWATLAEIGFNMASSKSPYVLQAIGEAAVAAMPGAKADKKERKETKDRALEGLMELGARNRKEAMEGLKVAIPLYQDGIRAAQFEKEFGLRERQLEQADTQFDRRMGLEERQIGALERQVEEGKSDLQRVFNVKYEQAKARNEQGIHPEGRRIGYKLSDAEIRDYAMKAALKEYRPGQGGMGSIPGLTDAPPPAGGASAPADFSGMSIVGSRPAQ